jgi:nucleoside-diphosphate-sugar epimerase
MTPAESQLPYLIIGCGYLGRRVAAMWRAEGKRVLALTRGRADELRAIGVEPVIGDILKPDTLAGLPRAAAVFCAVAPDRAAGATSREIYLDGLRNLLAALPAPGRFVHVSSTSVYGQTDGRVIDETSPTEPSEESGRIALAAEELLRSIVPDAIVLRFAGIYGPGRVIRRAAVERGEPIAADPEKWLNLIHVEDGARAVVAAAERGRPGGTYLIADGSPVCRRDYYTFLAELLGAPAPHFTPPAQPDRTDRRASNRKMREELGNEPTYPDYRSGLQSSL